MPPVRTGVRTASLRRPPRQAIEAAGRIGADGVALDLRQELPYADLSQTALRQLRKLLEDQRLAVGAAWFPLRRGLADPADLDRRVAAVMGAMSAAAKLGARVLIAPIGPLPLETDDGANDQSSGEEDPGDGDASHHDENHAACDRLIESLTAVTAHGDRVGARLAVATGAEPGDHLARFLKRLPEGVLGADLDPARLLAAGHDPLAAAQALGRSVLHVHANDAVRDLSSGGAVGVPLGRGSVDFPAILATLEQHEYRGWITVEGSGSTSPEAELADAVAYLRTVERDG